MMASCRAVSEFDPEQKSPVQQLMGGGDLGTYLSYRTYKLLHQDIPKHLEMIQQGRWWYWDERMD